MRKPKQQYREEAVYATVLGRTSRYVRRVPINQHGIDCQKQPHIGTGYLHAEDDDRPYEDFEPDHEPKIHRSTSCRYCGKKGLWWGKRNGQWRLFNGQWDELNSVEPHSCPQYQP